MIYLRDFYFAGVKAEEKEATGKLLEKAYGIYCKRRAEDDIFK